MYCNELCLLAAVGTPRQWINYDRLQVGETPVACEGCMIVPGVGCKRQSESGRWRERLTALRREALTFCGLL